MRKLYGFLDGLYVSQAALRRAERVRPDEAEPFAVADELPRQAFRLNHEPKLILDISEAIERLRRDGGGRLVGWTLSEDRRRYDVTIVADTLA